MENRGTAYYDHFAKFHGGEPCQRGVFQKNENTPLIQILHYKKVFKACTVLSSVGLSAFASYVGRIAEVSLVTDCEVDESATILANALINIINRRVEIGRGQSLSGISSISEEFSKTYDKNAVYFTTPYPFPDEYEDVELPEENNTGYVYLAFFISQREHEFLVSHGVEDFENLLEEKKVDPFDLKRVSVI